MTIIFSIVLVTAIMIMTFAPKRTFQEKEDIKMDLWIDKQVREIRNANKKGLDYEIPIANYVIYDSEGAKYKGVNIYESVLSQARGEGIDYVESPIDGKKKKD